PAQRSTTRHLGLLIPLRRSAQSHLQPPPLPPRSLRRSLRRNLLPSRLLPHQSNPLDVGDHDRRLHSPHPPASFIRCRHRLAPSPNLRKKNLLPHRPRVRFIL